MIYDMIKEATKACQDCRPDDAIIIFNRVIEMISSKPKTNQLMTRKEAAVAYSSARLLNVEVGRSHVKGLEALGLIKFREEEKQPEADFVTVARAIGYAYSNSVHAVLNDETANIMARVAIETYKRLNK